MQMCPYNPKKVQKIAGKRIRFGLLGFYYELPYGQGQQTEVPLDFEIFTIKVVGQTIQAQSTTKISRLQSNGIVKLGLVKSFVLYCNLAPHELQKCGLKLVIDFQINFLCIGLKQVDHLKVLRGSFQKIWVFHLPYCIFL